MQNNDFCGRQLRILLAVTALACVLCLLFAPTAAFADELTDSPIILLDNGATEGKRVEIVATLARNSGICSMLLALNYDDSALKLVKVTEGSALGELSCVRSGTYDTKPYKMHYMWTDDPENSYSTGVLLRFVFEIREGAADGDYKITLKAEDEVIYFDSGVLKEKKLVSGSATVTVKGDETVVVVTPGTDVDPAEPSKDILTPILISVCAVVIIAAALTVIFILRQGKSSKK